MGREREVHFEKSAFFLTTSRCKPWPPADSHVIRQLFHGFGKGMPAFRRWQLLAQRKITEMDDLIARAKKMKRLLQKADRCKCLQLEDCGKAFREHR